MGPIAGTGHTVDENGRFQIDDLVAARWRIDVYAGGRVVASSEVQVPSGGQATVHITIDPLEGPSST